MGNSVVYIKPYDAEIEYLESTGTQWIDTGIIPDSEHKYEVTVSKTADNTAEVVPLGSWNAWQNAMFGSDIKNSTVGIYILWGGDSHQTNIITNDWITLYGEKGLSKATLISTGEVLASRNFMGNFTCNQSAYLFALNRNGSVVYRGSCKISRAKIWNGDTLVRDFIPVRVGSVGYMYDRVSGKLFGNKGTGNFILGNDVAVPNLRRVVYVPKYDAEVEYLQSSGTQWIDTKIIATNNTSIDTGFLRVPYKSNFYIVGARPAGYKNNEYAITPYNNGACSIIYGNAEGTNLNSPIVNNTYYRCVTNKNRLSLYDSEGTIVTSVVASTNSFNTQYSLAVFGENRGGTVLIPDVKLRLYYLKIYDNTTLVRDFIPVRVGSVGYMYDKVSGQLFGNSGTGNFVLGQDVAKPIVKRYVCRAD